ncbi:RagB/SusD family nutrient uptake outer membrane protein [Prevotella sp. P5-92]|uniref:RagB/SusD family nutrient uptake outer membrane protein n=1 Tax=Prevotella sp. P5-92 TaxID=2024222 RepID=UPI000B9719DD|nr:RagB/SusD family nutrient uptake outer membrane protein [Prevotella sp. P5-92]OYP57713.1 RagB/SusD family nutrient uptake outer membrane protein [Prevotella sp. P5-92]
MKTKNIILYLTALLTLSSCQDMFAPADENNRQEDAMYEESKYAAGLLMYGYSRLPYATSTQTDVATDDAVTNNTNSSFLNMATGTWAADNDPMSQWNSCKDGIQYVNKFLTIVDKVKWAPSAASKQQMFIDRQKGEAYGLRALFYYYLLQAHGGYADDDQLYGVPLLTEPEDGSSDFNQPRALFSDCVKQCFADCDSAMKYLPTDYVDLSVDEIPAKYKELGAESTGYNLVFGSRSKGLMSGKIAEAIKAQVALLAASPAFRDQSGVTSAEAAVLCANVLKRIDGLNGFDKDGSIWYKNHSKLDPSASEMPEILWRADRSKDANQERENFPPTLYGNGRVNPSQNLVDAFPMRSGRPITDPKSGYDPKNPYANRDPRLSDDILYNGVTFRNTLIITGTYPNDKDESLDNINYGNTSTRTGYYMKKLLNEKVSPLQSSLVEQYHIYPRIRYTEMFLAYAEAANDAWGPKADPTGVGFTAYDVIKAIRQRAGLGKDEIGFDLPEGDAYLEECAADQAKMTELIRNERRIELCFENKRFWDLRRWKMPLNETVKGIMIDRNDEGELSYKVIDVEERKYDSSYQWYGPIPKSEVLKWSNLKQNKGWR